MVLRATRRALVGAVVVGAVLLGSGFGGEQPTCTPTPETPPRAGPLTTTPTPD